MSIENPSMPGVISLKRMIICPFCHALNSVDLFDEATVTSTGAAAGRCDKEETGTADPAIQYTIHCRRTCFSCEETFLITGDVTEWPIGNVYDEDISTIPSSEVEK